MFKVPFSFNGRIRRLEYGISYLLCMLYATALDTILKSYGETSGAVMFLFISPALWFFWAQGAKRCHDLENSGWFQFIPFYIFWLFFAIGKRGKNEYGNDPKDSDEEESGRKYVRPEIVSTPDQND